MLKSWQTLPLEEMAELVRDTVDPKSAGDTPYIGLEHIGQETLHLTNIGASCEVTSTKFRFRENDILFGKLRPYFRKVYFSKISGICSTDIFVFRSKNGVDPKFLFYLMADWKFVNLASGCDSGTRMPRADGHFLSKTQWSIPHLSEQRAIGSILGSLDDKIDLLRRENNTLEAMAETLFRQCFVEEDPQGWECKTLDTLANFQNGLACQKFRPTNNIDRLPVLKIKELNDGITPETEWATSQVASKYIVELGDVIFSWSGSLVLKIWGGERCVLNQHLFKVTSHEYPKWLYYLWTKQYLPEYIGIAEGKSTTMGHIQKHDLIRSTLIPPKDILADIDGKISPYFEKIIFNLRQIQTLIRLRDTLLPKLMSGELRVRL